VKARIVAARLDVIPELFREASFQGYKAQNPQQERAVALMRNLLEGNWYMTGPYGSGKTHLFYAQYRVLAGGRQDSLPCAHHQRTA
jgi:DNA replication protein DnaC